MARRKQKKVSEVISQSKGKSVNEIHQQQLTYGERASDYIATKVGSWGFIFAFLIILIFWIILNAFILITKPFDPYPFILLNLVLSCIAAIQAPIIMMSQNRQEAKDSLRIENDYLVDQQSIVILKQLENEITAMKKEQKIIRELLEKNHEQIK
jgi:uncharacterized membrane protein